MKTRIALLAAAVLATASVAFAADVKIGTATIALTAPPRQCQLDKGQRSDARMLDTISKLLAGRNELLAMYADCDQLKNWRSGARPLLDDFAQYQTLISAKDTNYVRADAIKEICPALRAEGEKVLGGLLPDVKERTEKLLSEVKMNETRFLGVLAEDATGCYFALLQKLQTEAGTEKTQVTLAGVTVAKGKLIYYYLYSPYVNADTMNTMLTRHKANVGALIAANGG